jgi:RNA polymerase sigma-70 factor, ECF subfamily
MASTIRKSPAAETTELGKSSARFFSQLAECLFPEDTRRQGRTPVDSQAFFDCYNAVFHTHARVRGRTSTPTVTYCLVGFDSVSFVSVSKAVILRGAQVEDVQVVAMLVRRCIAGDAAAWEEIVQTYNRRIFNICYRFAGSSDDAQDLTQEVFIRMYRTLSSYDHTKGAFVTWVTTITRNLLVDHFRKTKQERMTDSMDTTASEREDAQPLSEQIPDQSAPPDAHVRSREVSETVHAALGRLSPELREAVILRDLQDMDYREIATVLKVPEGTVKSRINRGRAELARLLQRTYRQVM